jgi:hypothetical protein
MDIDATSFAAVLMVRLVLEYNLVTEDYYLK